MGSLDSGKYVFKGSNSDDETTQTASEVLSLPTAGFAPITVAISRARGHHRIREARAASGLLRPC